MELRQLRYVLMVAEERSFSKAADKVHIAQPSLSQQVIKLEKELGVQLLERQSGNIQVTYAGQRFIDQASKIIDQVELLKKEMQDMADMNKGQLIIGSLPITGAHLLPLALPILQKDFPGVELILIEEKTANLENLTARGQTDVSLLSMPIKDPSLEVIPLLEEEILMVVPSNHPFSKKSEIALNECRNESFIFLKKEQGFREISERLCGLAGFEPKVFFESANLETVQSLVAAGMGITLIPKMVARRKTLSSNLVYIPICDVPAKRNLVLSYKKGRYLSKAAKSLISVMKTIAAEGNY
ncbi:LysR family transcriptional regulator [Peribacillus frigoritolerans]|uniref:LysR family transcriptional regulator n=1 Tax=Peribacillus frigoritolerans TaxID=450367 RepID=UPI003F7D861F